MADTPHPMDDPSAPGSPLPAASGRWGSMAFLASTLLALSLALLIRSTADSRFAAVTHPSLPRASDVTQVEMTADSLDIGAAGATQDQALVLTLQGARSDFMETYIADGTMRGLALLATKGLVTEFTRGVDPPSPLVSHVSLACGSRPRVTGVVGERFRVLGQPIEPALDASGETNWGTPPIWEWSSADTSQEEPKSALLFWPGAWGRPAEGADIVVQLEQTSGAPENHRPRLEIRTRPAALADEIVARVGEPSPVLDVADVHAGVLRQADYLASIERQLLWKSEVIAYIQDHYRPQLLFASLDSVRLGSELALAATGDGVYDPVLRQVYRSTDQAVGSLLADVDLGTTTVLVGSPHGYASANTAVNLNAILAALAQRDGQPALRTYSSGGAAHVVVNLAGREPGGIVPEAQYALLVEQIQDALTGFTLEDRPVFERVAAGSALWEWGLDTGNTGDVFVQAWPGFLLVDQDPSGEDRLSWPVAAAVAGYASSRPSMRGSFVLAGPRIPARGFVGPIELVDIAPTLAVVLHLTAPASVEGRPLRELLTP